MTTNFRYFRENQVIVIIIFHLVFIFFYPLLIFFLINMCFFFYQCLSKDGTFASKEDDI